MPHKLPEPISQHIKATIPATHKIWWIRGVVLGYKIVPHPSQTAESNERDILVSVGDLDAVGDGYDVRLEGTRYDVAEGDIVSLFGHEESGASQITQPRVLLMHSTGAFDKVFPSAAALDYDEMVGLDYRNWLATKVRQDSALHRAGKSALPTLLFGMSASPLLPSLTEKALRGVFNKLGPKSLHDNPLPTAKEKAMQDFSDYRYTDVTDAYKQLVHFISAWALNNPDAEKGFVVAKRGGNTQGQLVE